MKTREIWRGDEASIGGTWTRKQLFHGVESVSLREKVVPTWVGTAETTALCLIRSQPSLPLRRLSFVLHYFLRDLSASVDIESGSLG